MLSAREGSNRGWIDRSTESCFPETGRRSYRVHPRFFDRPPDHCRGFLGLPDTQGMFEIVIQLGAVLAVIWFYRKVLWRRVSQRDASARRFWLKLLVAFIPAAVAGLAFERFIFLYLFNSQVVALALVAGGIVLWSADRRSHGTVDPVAPGGMGYDLSSSCGSAMLLHLHSHVTRWHFNVFHS